MKKFFSSFHGLSLFLIAKCAVLVPISYKLFASDASLAWIVHTVSPYFSLYNCVKPLSGAFGGIGGAFMIALASLVSSIVLKGSAVFSTAFLSLHLPGLAASLYWATAHWLVRLALPLLCIVLFIVHPVGMGAWAYTLLWFVPVVLWVKGKASLFEKALASTITAHAVGSVIWLYTLPSVSSFWVALIPMALTERFFFAAGMVIAYHLYALLVQMVCAVSKKGVAAIRNSFVA